MKCSRAKISIDEGSPVLVLELPHTDIVNWLEQYEHRLPLDIEIKTKRKQRSVDANAYMWVLCDKIAIEVGLTKEEVYRQHIYNVGVFTDIAVPEREAQAFIENFESNGVGWIAEKQTFCKLPNCAKIRCYYGSSTYDTKQMSRLIDSVVQEAKEYGIETLPPDEITQMIGRWL